MLHRYLITNCAYQIQNGRRYHSYHEGEYVLVHMILSTFNLHLRLMFKQPNDEREQDRLDLVSVLLIPTRQNFNDR